MALTIGVICILAVGLIGGLWYKRTKENRHEREEHSISPEALHALISSAQPVLLFDVRQPLDLLANSEIIPGAKRIPPDDLLANPELLPREKESVVYCTCPSDKTSRLISKKAHAMNFLHIRFLAGGLAGWKALGYPVERYEDSFRLYSGV
jgi:rhodanese-related sulfurtransferase